MTNISIKHQSFVYTQLNDPTVLFLTIQFIISLLFALSLNVTKFNCLYNKIIKIAGLFECIYHPIKSGRFYGVIKYKKELFDEKSFLDKKKRTTFNSRHKQGSLV